MRRNSSAPWNPPSPHGNIRLKNLAHKVVAFFMLLLIELLQLVFWIALIGFTDRTDLDYAIGFSLIVGNSCEITNMMA